MKLRSLYNVIAVFSLILGVASLFPLGPGKTLATAALGLCLVYLVAALVRRSVAWYAIKTGIRAFLNRDTAPSKYHVPATLHACAAPNTTLEVVGRTCISWLCGDERDVDNNDEEAAKRRSALQEMLLDAIRRGGAVHFFIQNPCLSHLRFDPKDQTRLRKHAEASIQAYEDAKDHLAPAHKHRLNLSIVNDTIENSMIRLSRAGHVIRTTLDLSAQFRAHGGRVSKPLLVVETGREDAQEFLMQEFDYYAEHSVSYEDFKRRERELHETAEKTITEHKHYSETRKDESSRLAVACAQHFIAENSDDKPIPPPLSVQFLLTNQCTTQCTMCDHHKLYDAKAKDELSEEEQNQVLRMIAEMGTTAVIFSGGEPLAGPNLLPVLTHAKNRGLHAGLLTNGVCPDNMPISTDMAKHLAATCEWVQISIDSFNPETYAAIRGENYLPTVLQSLEALVGAKCKTEVCYTIQKANIDEVLEMPENIRVKIPDEVAVRFKFAHGSVNKGDFLPSKKEIGKLCLKLAENRKLFNWEYLLDMITKGYFDPECMARGFPLERTIYRYAERGYKCHALRLSCVIDAKGDVYPCCFLFDDNQADSKIRPHFHPGSLRENMPSGGVPPVGNPLADIWQERMQWLRAASLPIHTAACSACTRHFHHNELLNELRKVFEEGRLHEIAESFAQNDGAFDQPIWV